MIARPPSARLARSAATIAIVVAALGPGAGAPHPAGATTLVIRNHVSSNDVRALASWNGVLVAGTTGGLVTVAMPAGPATKLLRAPAGLPSNEILSLATSPSGSLWIGTVDRGIARLLPDGRFRRTLTSFDGLPSDRVQALFREGDSLWAGTSGGVALFTENPATGQAALRRSDSNASTAGALVSDDVRAFARIGDTLWVGTGGGLSAFVSGAWLDRRAAYAGAVNALLASGDTLWIGTTEGPRAYAGGILAPVGAGHAGATLSLIERQGVLYEGTNGSVFRLSGGSWVLEGAGLPNGKVGALGIAPDGALWAGTDGGVARYDDASQLWIVLLTDGPAVNSLKRAAVAAGSAWFTPGNATAPGLGGGLLLRYDGSAWSAITAASTGGALQPTSLFGILAARDERLWLGHCCSDGSPIPRVELYDPRADLWLAPGGANVLGFGQAPSGRVHAASDRNGVYIYDGATGALLDSLTPLNTQGSAVGAGLVSASVMSIAFDPNGVGWIGLKDQGVDRWRGQGTDTHSDDAWSHFATGFPSTTVLSIVVLDTATVYVGTAAGIGALKYGLTDASRRDAINAAIGGAAVRDLVHDGHRIVWLGTSAGIARLDDATGAIERFTTADGLVDDDVEGLAWDEARSILWVATAHGVSEVHARRSGQDAFDDGAYAYPNPATPASGPLRVGGLLGSVTGEIRDPAGRRIRNFRADPVGNVVWDYRDASGASAASGIYLVVLRDGDRTRILKVAVTR